MPINSATAALELSPKEKAAIAYRLYDEEKTAIQVVTRLYLPENEATRYYREFWRLERDYQLLQIYPEIQYSLSSFLKLFKGLKKYG